MKVHATNELFTSSLEYRKYLKHANSSLLIFAYGTVGLKMTLSAYKRKWNWGNLPCFDLSCDNSNLSRSSFSFTTNWPIRLTTTALMPQSKTAGLRLYDSLCRINWKKKRTTSVDRANLCYRRSVLVDLNFLLFLVAAVEGAVYSLEEILQEVYYLLH